MAYLNFKSNYQKLKETSNGCSFKIIEFKKITHDYIWTNAQYDFKIFYLNYPNYIPGYVIKVYSKQNNEIPINIIELNSLEYITIEKGDYYNDYTLYYYKYI